MYVYVYLYVYVYGAGAHIDTNQGMGFVKFRGPSRLKGLSFLYALPPAHSDKHLPERAYMLHCYFWRIPSGGFKGLIGWDSGV